MGDGFLGMGGSGSGKETSTRPNNSNTTALPYVVHQQTCNREWTGVLVFVLGPGEQGRVEEVMLPDRCRVKVGSTGESMVCTMAEIRSMVPKKNEMAKVIGESNSHFGKVGKLGKGATLDGSALIDFGYAQGSTSEVEAIDLEDLAAV